MNGDQQEPDYTGQDRHIVAHDSAKGTEALPGQRDQAPPQQPAQNEAASKPEEKKE